MSWNRGAFASPDSSTYHLLGDIDGGSPFLSRTNSIASSTGLGSSSSEAHPPGLRKGTDALRRERPKTRYEDFEAGQNKLATTSHTQTYDIMPDIALLMHQAGPEKDDYLHDPGQRAPRIGDDRRVGDPRGVTKGSFTLLSMRGLLNAGALVIILSAVSVMPHPSTYAKHRLSPSALWDMVVNIWSLFLRRSTR